MSTEKAFESEFDKILSALGIVDKVKSLIKLEMSKFSTNNKIKLIDDVNSYMGDLINTDNNLKQLFLKISIDHPKTKTNIDKTIESLAKLQGLILLENIKDTTNCDNVVDNILEAFNNKLEVVNNILERRFNKNMNKRNLDHIKNNSPKLKQTDSPFKQKYLKYKMKYLKLKNN